MHLELEVVYGHCQMMSYLPCVAELRGNNTSYLDGDK